MSTKLRITVPVLLGLAFALAFTGCGNGNGNGTPTLTGISVAPTAAQRIPVDGSVQLTATRNPGDATDAISWETEPTTALDVYVEFDISDDGMTVYVTGLQETGGLPNGRVRVRATGGGRESDWVDIFVAAPTEPMPLSGPVWISDMDLEEFDPFDGNRALFLHRFYMPLGAEGEIAGGELSFTLPGDIDPEHLDCITNVLQPLSNWDDVNTGNGAQALKADIGVEAGNGGFYMFSRIYRYVVHGSRLGHWDELILCRHDEEDDYCWGYCQLWSVCCCCHGCDRDEDGNCDEHGDCDECYYYRHYDYYYYTDVLIDYQVFHIYVIHDVAITTEAWEDDCIFDGLSTGEALNLQLSAGWNAVFYSKVVEEDTGITVHTMAVRDPDHVKWVLTPMPSGDIYDDPDDMPTFPIVPGPFRARQGRR